MSRLLDRLLADDLLVQAWLRVRDNDGTAGIDGVSIAEFADNAFSRLARLRDQVRDGRYQPRPWRGIALHRAGRAPRYLAVPSRRPGVADCRGAGDDADHRPPTRRRQLRLSSRPIRASGGGARRRIARRRFRTYRRLYLDAFDEMIAAVPDRHLIRYGDDFVILCRDAESAERALEDAARWLADAGLALNFDKTRTATFQQGLSFLGVHFDA
jgi:retron-type reverse transcriptase